MTVCMGRPARGGAFDFFELTPRRFAVKNPDVLRLNWREASHCPAQVHEVWFDRRVERMHADFVRQPICLARVAAAAGGDDVGPLVQPTTGNRDKVIARE